MTSFLRLTMASKTTATALLIALLATQSFALRHAEGQFNAVQFGVLSRSGGQAGTEFDVRCLSGKRIDEIVQLRFSDRRITAELFTTDPLPFSTERVPSYGNFRVKITADTPPGRYEVRSVGRHGVSNPRLFLVSGLQNLTPANVSHDPAAPTLLAANQLLHAVATATNIDYFSLSLQAGQSVRISLLAQQLDSWMIGQLQLIDADGRIVVAARGGDGADPRLEWAVASTGDYTLVVHDFLYRGGGDFFYQIVARTGDDSASDLIGRSSSPRWLDPSSATVPDMVDEAVVVADTGLSESGVSTITPPCSITSTFSTRDDEDLYEFTANKGDQYVIDVASHRLQQPTDARLVVLQRVPQTSRDPTWKQVLTADDSQNVGGVDVTLRSSDPVAMFTAPEAGTYRIVVRDLDNGESLAKTQRYVLMVRKPDPRFDLVAFMPYPIIDKKKSQHIGSKIFRGGSEAIRVLAVRHDGWSGPIDISVDGLPNGMTCATATIAANQSQSQITLVVSDAAEAWTGPIRVTGSATIGDKKVVHTATPATVSWGPDHTREFVRSRLSSELVVSIADRDMAPISIQFAKTGVLEVKKGESLKLTAKLTRRDGGKAACVLRPRDLPPGVTAAEVTIAADKAEGTLEWKVTPKAATGNYSLWLQAETKIKVKANSQALQRAVQYRSHLKKLHDDPAQSAKLGEIKTAATAADARVEAAKPAAKEQELTVQIPSPHVTIRVVDP